MLTSLPLSDILEYMSKNDLYRFTFYARYIIIFYNVKKLINIITCKLYLASAFWICILDENHIEYKLGGLALI